jgi:transposase
MEITAAQFSRIEPFLPVQRGNVSLSNLQVVNAILYVAEHGCKWRGLPKRFGNWHTIYTRMNRWAKAGVLDRLFEELQHQQLIRVKIEAVSLDSTIVKVHPDGTGALKKGSSHVSGVMTYRRLSTVAGEWGWNGRSSSRSGAGTASG